MVQQGNLTILREERPEDLPFLVELRNDLETQAWSLTLPPDYTLGMYAKRLEGRAFSYDRSDGRFIIVEKDSNELIGSVVYSSLRSRWSATLGIIVAKPFWGGGYAMDALEVLLKFLFEELGLRVVRLWTHSGNLRAVGSAKKLGFTLSYRQREAIFKNGQLFDNIGMDLLRDEYYAQHPELTDHLPPLV
jgi:RimJ/RimL family protein N-acetyltransferase